MLIIPKNVKKSNQNKLSDKWSFFIKKYDDIITCMTLFNSMIVCKWQGQYKSIVKQPFTTV